MDTGRVVTGLAFITGLLKGWPLTELLEELTPAQREAVLHVDGPLLILAGPGSGKTRVVTHRIANLLRHGINARQILALTFTNKAAEEMKSRIERLAPGEAVWVSTFHRFCARLLRQFASHVGLPENYTIYDTADSRQALRLVVGEQKIHTAHYTPDQVAGGISWAKNKLISAEDYQARLGSTLGCIVAAVYPAYQAKLLSCGAVDFDDLLMHVANLLRENPEIRASLDQRHRYILVDEYQDTNLAQYAIVRALSLDHPNLSVTGDPDQSIYGWRGATLSNILDFENDYPHVKVVRLEQNYRSTGRILNVAGALIEHNLRRKRKALFTDNEDGPPVRLVKYATHRDEADGIASRIAGDVRSGRRRPRDVAVFYRVNALSRMLEHALSEQGLPYKIVNGVEFFQRKEIKDVLAYATLLNNPRDDVALLRIINTPTRGIGKKTIDRLREHAVARGLSLLEAARESGLIDSLPKRAPVAVAKFVAVIDHLSSLSHGAVEEVLGHILTESGYRQPLTDSTDSEDQDRLANIEELLTAAREFDARNADEGQLERFLEEVCLVNETDDWDEADDRVTLMTLHASKGLEFPVVYITALEEGILPHERSLKDRDQLEEERRLLFVGITRARHELQLSLTDSREFRGRSGTPVPSSFLVEMPREEMERVDLAPTQSATVAASTAGGWAKRRVAEAATAGAAITTAAEMIGQPVSTSAPVSPDAFHHGMAVRHPEYGLGKIVALGGSGARRTATVNFASAAGQKKFVLEGCALRPLTTN